MSSASSLLAGKTAVVLGVVNKWSIAYAIASAMRREGAKVILTCQNERLKKSVDEMAAEIGAAAVLLCDVTKDEDLTALAAQLQEHGPIDTVVHSIAFANKEDLAQPFVKTSREGFRTATDISAYSLVAVANALTPLMTRGGSIMTLSYLGAVRVLPNYNVMGVAKAALESSVRYLAFDLGASNIRVNAISAGAIKTASARGIKDFSKMLDEHQGKAPLRRNTDPAEVADTAVFLASDLGRGVTGNVIYVDAGYQIMAV
jgi:enoyl-[acyl-carrier protein] reductase I